MSKKGKTSKKLNDERESRGKKDFRKPEEWSFPVGGLIYTILVIVLLIIAWNLWNNDLNPLLQMFISMQSGEMTPETMIAFQIMFEELDIMGLVVKALVFGGSFLFGLMFLFLGIRAWIKGGRSW